MFFRSTARSIRSILGVAIGLGVFAAATSFAATGDHPSPAGQTRAYVVKTSESIPARFVPVFLVEHDESSYNKIGTPSARLSKHGHEEVYVDSATPTVYYAVDTFESGGETYTNYLYRVHFERSPFSLFPFNAGAGKNVGAIVVVTVDRNNNPVFVDSVQSCGCYHAIVPTDYLPQTALPPEWDKTGQVIYGEHLPGMLQISQDPAGDGRVVITIRDKSHRIGGVEWLSKRAVSDAHPVTEMTLKPIESLKVIPLGSGTTSFYYTQGHRRGLVKGAWKPWETLLFGALAFDSHVGQDREYGEKDVTGRRFYTTLRGWKKKDADMAHYAAYLRYNGWQL